MKKRAILLAMPMLTLSVMAQNATITTVDNTEFGRTIVSENVILVDVRTAQEFRDGYISSPSKAHNIDVTQADFDAKIAKLDRSKTIAVYCRSGVRSMAAAKKIAALGFNVINLRDGVSGWNQRLTKE